MVSSTVSSTTVSFSYHHPPPPLYSSSERAFLHRAIVLRAVLLLRNSSTTASFFSTAPPPPSPRLPPRVIFLPQRSPPQCLYLRNASSSPVLWEAFPPFCSTAPPHLQRLLLVVVLLCAQQLASSSARTVVLLHCASPPASGLSSTDFCGCTVACPFHAFLCVCGCSMCECAWPCGFSRSFSDFPPASVWISAPGFLWCSHSPVDLLFRSHLSVSSSFSRVWRSEVDLRLGLSCSTVWWCSIGGACFGCAVKGLGVCLLRWRCKFRRRVHQSRDMCCTCGLVPSMSFWVLLLGAVIGVLRCGVGLCAFFSWYRAMLWSVYGVVPPPHPASAPPLFPASLFRRSLCFVFLGLHALALSDRATPWRLCFGWAGKH